MKELAKYIYLFSYKIHVRKKSTYKCSRTIQESPIRELTVGLNINRSPEFFKLTILCENIYTRVRKIYLDYVNLQLLKIVIPKYGR